MTIGSDELAPGLGPGLGEGEGAVPGGIAEIPFPEVDVLPLLGFDPARSGPEMEYERFGHAHLPRVELVARGDGAGSPRRVVGARVFALHSADDGEAHAEDIDLEFWVDDETALLVSLALFLERRGAALVGSAPALVLALCNPHGASLVRPPGIDVPIFSAEGDVIAHFEIDPAVDPTAGIGASEIEHGLVRVQLVAERWRELS